MGRVRRRRFTDSIAAVLVAASLAAQVSASDCTIAMRALSRHIDAAACPRDAGVVQGVADAPAWIASAGDAIEQADFARADWLLDCAQAQIDVNAASTAAITLVRMRGNRLFRDERVADALPYYECAVSMSREAGDAAAEAVARNNFGVAWRRLGDPRRAMEELDRALSLQRRRSGRLYATTMMNYADLHRDLGDADAAMRDYRAALAAFEAEGAHAGAGHVLEGMGAVASDAGNVRDEEAYLQRALHAYGRSDHASVTMPRTYAGLIRVALKTGRLDDAKRWADHALQFAARTRAKIPAPVHVQIAEVERYRGRDAEAARHLQAALEALSGRSPDRVEVLEALAALRERAGDADAALGWMKQAWQLRDALYQARQAQDLKSLRMRVARDRAVEALEAAKAREQRRLRIVVWCSALALIAVIAGFLHRLWRVRLQAVARRVQHDADLAHYRQLAEALQVDRRVLQAALDGRDDAVCVLDGGGRVLAANAAALALLGCEGASLVGQPLAEVLQDGTREAWHALLDRLDDTGAATVELLPIGAETPVKAMLSDHASEEGVLLLRLAVAVEAVVADVVEASTGPLAGAAQDHGTQADFRHALVELMLCSIEIWERSTGLNRIELAERSRIWRVSIDGGRLRARTLDRYLSLAKLPAHPHWRDVLRTAYFVLGQTGVDDAARAGLQARLDAVLGFTRRNALV